MARIKQGNQGLNFKIPYTDGVSARMTIERAEVRVPNTYETQVSIWHRIIKSGESALLSIAGP